MPPPAAKARPTWMVVLSILTLVFAAFNLYGALTLLHDPSMMSNYDKPQFRATPAGIDCCPAS